MSERTPQPCWIADLAPLRRAGVKGPRAADWLAQSRLDVPGRANSWIGLRAAEPAWGVMVRLGSSEFLIEDEADGAAIRALRALGSGQRYVYPVMREDRSFAVGGHEADAVLAQVCGVDFARLDVTAKPAVMTLMTGVTVVVIPQALPSGRCYRIWCDPSFGRYLGDVLIELIREAGGEELAFEQLHSGLPSGSNPRGTSQ